MNMKAQHGSKARRASKKNKGGTSKAPKASSPKPKTKLW